MKLDIHYLFVPKYAKWIVIGLVGLFSFLILVEWGFFLISGSDKTVISNNLNTGIHSRQNESEHILKASLFGVYVPNDLNSVKKSMLDLILVGILYADKIEESQVILRSASGVEQNYKLGDTIPGDAVIKRITSGGVLVERNGILESLSLPKNELTFEPVAKPLEEE